MQVEGSHKSQTEESLWAGLWDNMHYGYQKTWWLLHRWINAYMTDWMNELVFEVLFHEGHTNI